MTTCNQIIGCSDHARMPMLWFNFILGLSNDPGKVDRLQSPGRLQCLDNQMIEHDATSAVGCIECHQHSKQPKI